MAPIQQQLRKALGVVKDRTSIGLAKVASAGAPDLDVALVKATSHDETPVEEKYIQEILHLTSYARSYVSACVAGVEKRLNKTHNWIVAIKTLMLIHRLLRDGDIAFEQELLHAGRRGMRVLYLSDFRDDSHSNGWDYSAFVRTYALFLDERLDGTPTTRAFEARSSFNDRRSTYDEYASEYGDYRSDRDLENGRRENSPQNQRTTASRDMKPQELLDKLPSSQRMLERILACRPTGAAKFHRLVQIALYPIVRESFQIYSDICDGLAVLLDSFFELEHQDCVKAFEIYSRGAKQVDELASFYGFCKNVGVCRSSEYPPVQKIPEELLETMEDFLRDSSGTNLRSRRHRSPEPKPQKPPSPDRESEQHRSPEPKPQKPPSPDRESETGDEARYEINGIKALPAPPVDTPITQPDTEKQDSETDLLNLYKATISSEEHGERLALALFSGTDSSTNKTWDAFSSPADQGLASPQANVATSTSQGPSDGENGAAGWELALVASASQLSQNNSNPMAGGFDRLLLDSMYDQAVDYQKHSSTLPSGSASSVALPGRPASSFLALPAPVEHTVEGDPFTTSLSIPPPPYVQMDDMSKKQQLLVQENNFWLQYERDGMQGYSGLFKLYNNPHLAPFQNAYAVPYYSTGRYATYY